MYISYIYLQSTEEELVIKYVLLHKITFTLNEEE